MRIQFTVGNEPVEFFRSRMTGRTELRLPGGIVVLQSPYDPATHVSFSLSRVWTHPWGNHEITIQWDRPLLLAGFRPNTYRIFVDNLLVAEKHGY